MLYGQVAKTLNVPTAGALSTFFTSTEKSTVTDLSITGTIDARDFKFMRDSLTVLVLDISNVNIAAYTGGEGTMGTSNMAYPANEIPTRAFNNYGGFIHSLTSVLLPLSANSIASYAFGYCSGLTSVTISTSIVSIGSNAFDSCTGLTLINVEAANQNYSSINGILFDKNQTTLVQYPGAKPESYYEIPSTVKTIGNYAFIRCNLLTSITIPSSVITIGSYAFYFCKGLTTITIPMSVTTIESFAFRQCTGLTSIDIPSSVTTIAKGTFSMCTGLKNIKIPSTITTIENQAFQGCSGLTSIYCYNSIPINLINLSAVFDSVNFSTCILYVPLGSKAAYQASDQWKDFVNIVEMTTGLEYISVTELILSPNPTLSNLKITSPISIKNIDLYSITGKLIQSYSVNSANYEINVNHFAKGIYLINAYTDNGVVTSKFVKE